ncbi:MAG: zinc-binding dehydrogenase [Myxococcota bacterium]|nr:zinc-binding dehydrogenase [Myxococcota bacterium]
MRAVVIREHGGPEVLRVEEVPEPTPGPGEALVRVRACALNHLDIWVRRGIPGAPFHLPITTGADVSGDIEALGEGVTGWEVGSPVMVAPGISCGACPRCESGADHLCPDYGILGETCPGGLSELVVVPAVNLFEKPERLSYEDAAAMTLSFLTAWHMLVARAALREGETVLVHAGGSGVGSCAVQIGRHLGAQVIATAGSARKLALATELGAHATINYRDEDFVGRVKALTDRRGVDVVFEHVGGEVFERSLRCLAWAGRLVTCGATTGIDARVNLRHLFFKSQSILGSTMGTRAEFQELVRLFGQGHFRSVIDRSVPMDEIAEAHRAIEAREVFGKVVIRP